MMAPLQVLNPVHTPNQTGRQAVKKLAERGVKRESGAGYRNTSTVPGVVLEK
jgi:hypothetical protein